jgi:tetratricopeptide (TPR) repeat protein
MGVVLPVALFFTAITVRSAHGDMRAGCSADEPVVAQLAAGTVVALRFAVNDGSDCYKVAAVVDGKPVEGYIGGSSLSGLEEFERERRAAPDGSSVRVMTPAEKLQKTVAQQRSDPTLQRASQLLEANQPSNALNLLEPLLKHPDPDALFLAGLASYRSDRVKDALDYWKQSLAMRPDDALARFYAKVAREAAADQSGQKLYGLRVVLRYEGENVRPDAARGLVAVLDEEFTRISGQLGCPAEERIVAIVQSRAAYLKSTDAAEWSGGQYDGRIRVSLPESGVVGPDTRRALAHEIVHACLANISTGWPAWLHEGLAQKLSGDTLSPGAAAALRQQAAEHALPRLENVGQSWSRMSTQHARLAYSLALAAVDALMERYANYGIRNILNNPGQLPAITADLDRTLGL